MGSSVRNDQLSDFGISDSLGNVFYHTVDQVTSDPQLDGQAHYMRRAFNTMQLDGILCIDNIPTVYFKNYQKQVARQEISALHQKFWNQGIGTLLVIQDPNQIRIFSGMAAPDRPQVSIDDHNAMVESFERVADVLEARQFIESVASGHYYRTHAKHFNAENSVDKYLLNNLGIVADYLCHEDNPTERKRVNSLLGRIIFTSYLVDREIIILQDYSFIRKQSVQRLVDILRIDPPTKARNLLYKLFSRLRNDFNGSMFDDNLDAERETVSDEDINNLRRFFEGEQLDSRQRTFDFWAYDFSIIPVETISAIYEQFLEKEDAKGKEAKGAFYTPKFLAEAVVDEAVGGFDTLLDKKYLDPACGSGIFLVILFNRLADEWLRRNPRAQIKTKARKFIDILEQKIRGVDVNLTACRIACFSLYIAFLDQFDPPTLREFQEKTKRFLPELLAYKNGCHKNSDKLAIWEGNFFDPKLPIDNDFDVVLGNPPWVGRNQPSDKQINEWVFGKCNPFLEDAPTKRTDQKAVFLPQGQIAHAFMWKAPTHLKDNRHASFLLPSEVLLNKTDAFQDAWLRRFEVNRVLHLADYRKFLFSGAKRPCFIASYTQAKPEPTTHRIEYVVPKVRQQDPRSGLIPVSPEDRKWISLQYLLDEARRSRAAVVWKAYLWGTERDVKFLDYLLQLDSLDDIAGEPGTEKRWIKGRGFQPWYENYDEHPETHGKPKLIPGKLGDPFISTISDNIQMFALEDDCISLRQRLESLRSKGKSGLTSEEKPKASLKKFRRSPDKQLFQPPLVLVNKGFTKFSFVDFHAFYQDSLTGFCGSDEDENLLRFFVVYINSKLATYFSFHTSGSWGTERDEVRVHELLRLPFLLPDSPHVNKKADSIVTEVASRMRRLQREINNLYKAEKRRSEGQADYQLQAETLEETRRRRVSELQAELEPLVYEYFDLSDEEITLIEDTCNVYEPSSTPATAHTPIPTLRETTYQDRLAYSTFLCDTLNEWSRIDQPKGKKQPFYFHAQSSQMDKAGMVLVTISKARKRTTPRDIDHSGSLGQAVSRIANASSNPQGSFDYLRGIIFGNGEKIHIFKQDLLGHWTKTSALNDADAVFQAIIQSKRRA